MSHTLEQTIQYTFGNEDKYIRDKERLGQIELNELLQLHREEALNAGKELATAFTTATKGFFDNLDGDFNDSTIFTSNGDTNFDKYDEDSAYDTEDDNSVADRSDSCSSDDEYQCSSDIYDKYDNQTDNGDDSTYYEDESEEDTSTCSIVDDDFRILVNDFHKLMKLFLEHNSASCLIQFILNKKIGKENDGPSLIQAMLPWTYSAEDGNEADSLLEN